MAIMATTITDPARLREILLFYADSGVDEALDEVAPDRFAQTAEMTRARPMQTAPEAEAPAQPRQGRASLQAPASAAPPRRRQFLTRHRRRGRGNSPAARRAWRNSRRSSRGSTAAT